MWELMGTYIGADKRSIQRSIVNHVEYTLARTRFNFDDSLDVIAVHLVGGIIGALLLGLFADTKVNSLGFDGVLFGGGSKLLVNQLIAIGATFVFSFAITWAAAKIIDATIGLRVSAEDELVGLDQSQHAESAYQ